MFIHSIRRKYSRTVWTNTIWSLMFWLKCTVKKPFDYQISICILLWLLWLCVTCSVFVNIYIQVPCYKKDIVIFVFLFVKHSYHNFNLIHFTPIQFNTCSLLVTKGLFIHQTKPYMLIRYQLLFQNFLFIALFIE